MSRYCFHVDPRDKDGAKDELAVQVAFRREMALRAPKVELVAIPNAGKRSAWEGRQRKREGMVKGFPDMLAMFNGQTCGLEFKSGTGSLSPAQIDCLNRLASKGFSVGVFRSAESAVNWLKGNMPGAFA